MSSGLDRIRTELQNIAGVATALAGATAFIYMIGGAVMWIRLYKAGLPADQAISLLPRDLLLVLGIGRVILPAAAAGISFYLLAKLPRTDKPGRKPRKRKGWLWKNKGHLAVIILLPATVCWLFVLPFTATSVIGIAAIMGAIIYYEYESRTWRSKEGMNSFPAYRVAFVAVMAVAAATLVREWQLPASLERASILAKDNKRLAGGFITSDSDAFYLAIGGELVILSRDLTEQVNLRPAAELKKPPSLLQLFAGYRDLEVVIRRGNRETRITNDWANDASPEWAPDGSRIAFRSDRDGNFEIYSANPNGTGLVRLTDNPAFDGGIDWSADGEKLAFVSDRDGNDEIYTMGAEGSGQLRLIRSGFRDGGPVWSPDGTRIAFNTSRHGNDEIYSMDADGSNQTRLTDDPGEDNHPTFSPDGQKILFESSRDGNLEIYVMNSDGSNPVRLTNEPGVDSRPAWSPDGTKIAFQSNRDGNFNIYVMGSDGSRQKAFTKDESHEFTPAWSPNEDAILFSRLLKKGVFS